MRKPFKLCILHIGTEKTGSSSIQAFLSGNRRALLKDGVFYPDTGAVGTQWEFVALAHKAPWSMDIGRVLNITDHQSQQTFKTQFLENFTKQITQAGGADTLLISAEHFHSRLNTHAMVESLKSILDPFVEDYKILVYFRRQDEVAVSLFSTQVKSGFEGIALTLPEPTAPAPYYDYASLVTRWASVFGLDKLSGGLYNQALLHDDGILADFCDKVDIDLDGKKIPKWQNSSVSAIGLKFIQAVNKLYKYQGEAMSARERGDLIRRSSAANKGKFYPLSEDQAKSFYARFSDSNEQLRLMLFPENPAPLFLEDFSQYPKTAETLPNDDESFIQTVKAWRKPQGRQRLRALAKKTKRLLNGDR